MWETFKRGDKKANGPKRQIVIESCYHDCPYAIDKHSRFSCSFDFTCTLLNKEITFDDNLIHFGVLEECPLDKFRDTDSELEDQKCEYEDIIDELKSKLENKK